MEKGSDRFCKKPIRHCFNQFNFLPKDKPTPASRHRIHHALNYFISSIELETSFYKSFCFTSSNPSDITSHINTGPKSSSQMSPRGRVCCRAPDARQCMCFRSRVRQARSSRRPALPDILVPHYEEDCVCFSCGWIRETRWPFIQSLLYDPELEFPGLPVVNPTHSRVPPTERQRLLTPVPKRRFQIMYIYAMELGPNNWRWVVVPRRPHLPFLLEDEKYSQVSRFARHPDRGWFGLRDDGQQVDIDQEMTPPLHNPLYVYFGYEPQSSPYRIHRQGSHYEEKASDDKASTSSNDHTDSSYNSNTSPSPNSKTDSSPDIQTVNDQNTSAIEKLPKPSAEVQTNTSPEAQATLSKQPASQSTSDSDHDEWSVVDPQYANSPYNTGNPGSGRYYQPPRGNRHTYLLNTTIFVGGLNENLTHAQLQYWFEGFGELQHVRKKIGNTHGFVQYSCREKAEMAMSQVSSFTTQPLTP